MRNKGLVCANHKTKPCMPCLIVLGFLGHKLATCHAQYRITWYVALSLPLWQLLRVECGLCVAAEYPGTFAVCDLLFAISADGNLAGPFRWHLPSSLPGTTRAFCRP